MNRYRVSSCVAVVILLALLHGPAARAALVSGGLSLTDTLAAYGFTDYSVYGSTILFRSRHAVLSFENGSRKVLVNGMTVYLNGGIGQWGNDWVIRPVDMADTLGPLLRPDPVLKSVPWGTVLIDPGHGGSDPGTRSGRGIEEKRLTLDLAKRVRIRLRDCGVSAVLTRDRDQVLTLDERCDRAARLGAALFVSIHLNSSKNAAISGVETFVVPAAGYPATADALDPRRLSRPVPCPGNRYDSANVLLAACVHRGLLSQTGTEDRGVRRARFYVIRNASCPAALVECGFLSNTREAARLADEAYRDRVAEGVARGILTYLVRAREARLPPVRAD